MGITVWKILPISNFELRYHLKAIMKLADLKEEPQLFVKGESLFESSIKYLLSVSSINFLSVII